MRRMSLLWYVVVLDMLYTRIDVKLKSMYRSKNSNYQNQKPRSCYVRMMGMSSRRFVRLLLHKFSTFIFSCTIPQTKSKKSVNYAFIYHSICSYFIWSSDTNNHERKRKKEKNHPAVTNQKRKPQFVNGRPPHFVYAR
jgi:hypothetical protein